MGRDVKRGEAISRMAVNDWDLGLFKVKMLNLGEKIMLCLALDALLAKTDQALTRGVS